jgi:hypothetical protein
MDLAEAGKMEDNRGFGHIKTEEQLAALPVLQRFGERVEMRDGEEVRIPVMRDDILVAYMESDDILSSRIGDDWWYPVLTKAGWYRERVMP